jgi:hypothetical protein
VCGPGGERHADHHESRQAAIANQSTGGVHVKPDDADAGEYAQEINGAVPMILAVFRRMMSSGKNCLLEFSTAYHEHPLRPNRPQN